LSYQDISSELMDILEDLYLRNRLIALILGFSSSMNNQVNSELLLVLLIKIFHPLGKRKKFKP
jgi:hypothetical protein